MSTENVLKFPKNPKSATSKIFEKLNFFTTAPGINLTHRVIGTVAIGVSATYWASHTYFLRYYIDFVRAYRNGLPLDVPEPLELIIDNAADKVKLKPRETPYLKSFMTSGFDINTCGSMNSTFAGYVGLPMNYLYDSTRDIDRFSIQLRTEAIDWNSKWGELLEKSLVLTKDEKLFAITRSVLELRNSNHVHSALIPVGAIFGLYTGTQVINRKYNLFQYPRSARIVMYGLLTTFAMGVYIFVTDTIRIQQAVRVDKALVDLGSDVIEAGIRFYEKILNKNIAVRELSGKDLYSVKGNEYPGILRFNTLPLTTRKLFLEQALEESRKKEAAAKNTTADTIQAENESRENDSSK